MRQHHHCSVPLNYVDASGLEIQNCFFFSGFSAEAMLIVSKSSNLNLVHRPSHSHFPLPEGGCSFIPVFIPVQVEGKILSPPLSPHEGGGHDVVAISVSARGI